MAGATNRAFKAAGIPKAAIKELRVTGGRGLTLRSAISLAEKHGVAVPQKAKDYLEKRDSRMAAMKRKRNTASVRDVSRVMLANRKAEAQKRPASPVVGRGGKASARISDLRRLPMKDVGLDVRVTPAVLKEYFAPPTRGTRTVRGTRRDRLSSFRAAMSNAVENAPAGAKTIRWTQTFTGEGGIAGAGVRQEVTFKARLLSGKGKGGQDMVAVNVIGGGREKARAKAMAERVAQGSSAVAREGGALRLKSGASDTVAFKHRGETVYAVRKRSSLRDVATVARADGTIVRNRDAMKRGGRILRAMASRSKNGPSPAMKRGGAKREAAAAAQAAVAKRQAFIESVGKNRKVRGDVVYSARGGVERVSGSFTHKGKTYRVSKFGAGGFQLDSQPKGKRDLQAVRKRAERVIRAVEKRHASGKSGVATSYASPFGG